jgi:site-specific recombinase XerD
LVRPTRSLALVWFHAHLLLRHACATHLHEHGVKLRDIADLLGHSNLAIAAI